MHGVQSQRGCTGTPVSSPTITPGAPLLPRRYCDFPVAPINGLHERCTVHRSCRPFIGDSPRVSFYRANRSAARCQGKLFNCSSVRLAVCPSVTLRYRGHRLEFLKNKIISRLISLAFRLSADSDITNLLQREHPKV